MKGSAADNYCTMSEHPDVGGKFPYQATSIEARTGILRGRVYAAFASLDSW